MSGDLPVVISRADARAQGLRHFFTGQPCWRGHMAPRRTRSGKCEDCCTATRKAREDTKLALEIKLRAKMESLWRPRLERQVRAEVAREGLERRKEEAQRLRAAARETAKVERQRAKRRAVLQAATKVAFAGAPDATQAVLAEASGLIDDLAGCSTGRAPWD